jgi:hypothetical protein
MGKMTNDEIPMTNQCPNNQMMKASPGRFGRAAARPYRIDPGRDDLPVVRGSLEGSLVIIFPLLSPSFSGKFIDAFGRRLEVM